MLVWWIGPPRERKGGCLRNDRQPSPPTSPRTPEAPRLPPPFSMLHTPLSSAFLPPPPSTFHTSLGVATCHFIRFHIYLPRTVLFTHTDCTSATRTPPSAPPSAVPAVPALARPRPPGPQRPAARTAHLPRCSAGCALGRRWLSSAGRPRLQCPPGPP